MGVRYVFILLLLALACLATLVNANIETELVDGIAGDFAEDSARVRSEDQKRAALEARVISYEAVHTAKGMTFSGTVADVTYVTLRASSTPLTGQAGWRYSAAANSNGFVTISLTQFTNTDTRYWQLESGVSGSAYGTVIARGQVSAGTTTSAPTPSPTLPPTPTPTSSATPAPTPSIPATLPPTRSATPSPTSASTPAPTRPATPTPTSSATSSPTTAPSGSFTGGSGGALTDRTFLSFTNSAGTSSQYHIYAAGLDWSKSVGVLIYGDGSGGYGFKNPTQSYLLAGTNGLAAVAKRLNLLLIFPLAPLPGCPTDNCWYDSANAASKARWAADLVLSIYKLYNLDKSRVVISGYSSGAQLSAQFLFPAHGGELMTGGVVIPISFGGRPYSNINMPAALKSTVTLSWDCGADDTSALSASTQGEAWYRSQGWKTQINIVPGVAHSRSGVFGGIVEREAREHLRLV